MLHIMQKQDLYLPLSVGTWQVFIRTQALFFFQEAVEEIPDRHLSLLAISSSTTY